jgi:hypothetical protein
MWLLHLQSLDKRIDHNTTSQRPIMGPQVGGLPQWQPHSLSASKKLLFDVGTCFPTKSCDIVTAPVPDLHLRVGECPPAAKCGCEITHL